MPAQEIMSSAEIARGIVATVDAARSVVKFFVNAKVSLPHAPRTKALRAAPGFARGKNLHASGRVLYTTKDVAEYIAALGNAPRLLEDGGRAAGKWVQVAMLLLEHFELHPDEEPKIMAGIKSGKPGYRLNSLLKTLRSKSKFSPRQRKAVGLGRSTKF